MPFFLQGIHYAMRDVALALFPLLLIFIFFQLTIIRWSLKRFVLVLKGLVLAFFGLVLFLHGVNIGFIPVGSFMGKSIGDLSYRWIMIPLGLMLGFLSCFAEPAIQVLVHEVEKTTGGYINKTIMLYFLSIGVAISVALSVIRVFTGLPLLYFLLPGYTLALLLSRKVSKIFTAIAFDSGGVVTGPVVVTFVLALVVGFSNSLEGSNPLMDAFGMVSLVSLIPILSILVLGILYERKGKNDDE